MTADHIIEKIREALEKVEVCEWFVDPMPMNNGLTRVDDGKSSGIFPIRGETFEMNYVAAVNPQNIAVLLAALDAKDAETRCIVADVAKDFRAVNVDAVMAQMGDVVPMLLHRAEAAEAERDALRKAAEALANQAEHCVIGSAIPGMNIKTAMQYLAEASIAVRRTLAGDNHE